MLFRSLAATMTMALSFQALAFTQGMMFHKESLKQKKLSSKKLSNLPSPQLTFEQRLNHADETDARTFKQRYFVDSQYAADETSPVFYIICGEWNCAGANSYGYATNLAKKFKAHLVALEHRYYGESLPFTELTTENLQYLNLDAAIADLASFQKFMTNDKKLSGKWFAFGGSYAGTLASFYRLKHPELVSGALASSGPVLMKPEFSEYDAHVAKVINKSTCGDKVREAVALIEQQMSTPEGAAEVKKLFEASDVRNDKDFMYVVADMLAAAVQYGRDTAFCKALTESEDLVMGYAKGGLLALGALGSTPVEISMQAAEKIEVTSKDMFRQWMWQSCSEFGWFQVANGTGTGTSRSSMIDLQYHAEVCERLYQKPMRADGSMNKDWFDPLLTGVTSHIIFSNGSNDPWLTLSITDATPSNNASFPLVMMEGAAHCNDLKAFSAIPSVVEAQVRMEQIFADWISEK